MFFDRFDICEAYLHFHVGGWLRERPSNRRRMESTGVQLHRMQFRPAPGLEFHTLTENGKAIYRQLVVRYGFQKSHADAIIDECRDLDTAA